MKLKPMRTELSPDIALFHILPRLPAKSVSRFKCVSKQWHSFIRAPGFPKMHLHHQNQHKLLFLPNNRPWDFFTIDCETPEDGCTPFRRLPFKVRHGQDISILTSLHGMVCAGLVNPNNILEYCDLILWNPVTGDHKTLSKAGSHKDCYDTCKGKYGLCYISSEDTYKLVCVTVTGNHGPVNVYIYSLKSDSWRKVETPGSSSNQSLHHLRESVLFKEKLYFIKRLSSVPELYQILMFDTQTEKLRDIKTPHFGNQRAICIGLMVVRDSIHFCVGFMNSIGQYDTIEQWRMDGDGDGDGDGDWTMVETCSLKEQLPYYDDPQHLMRNGNWLVYSRLKEHVYVLDTKKHTNEIMCAITIAFRPEGTYIETFVSPNQYLK